MNHQPVIEKVSNGLTISSDYIENAETVSIYIMVKTGARYEGKQQNGISHFLEHMAFKGTAHRNAREIAEAFDAIGGHFNAHTSHEETSYYAKVLKQDWKIALDILTDIIQNSTYPSDELERERGVILQEIAQYQDQPDALVMDNFSTAAFPEQPLGRSILGESRVIQSVTRDDMVEYVRQHYYTGNIVVSAAGAIDHESFSSLIQEKFSKLPNQGQNDVEPGLYKGNESRLTKDLEQINLCLGFVGVPYVSDVYHVYKMLAIILGGGMSSRLFQEVREKRGLAYTISAFPQSYHDCGVFGIFSACAPENVNQLLDVTIEQIKLIQSGIGAAEIDRARSQIRAAVLMSRESTAARAEKLASNIANFNRYIHPQETLDKIAKITESDLISAAQGMWSRGSLHVPTFASVGKTDKMYSYQEVIDKIMA